MRDRSSSTGAKPVRRSAISVDVVLFTPQADQLAVLLARHPDGRGRERWVVPWDARDETEPLDDAAARIARTALGTAPAWLEQVGAFGDRRRHPSEGHLSIAYVGLVPAGASAEPPADAGMAWYPLQALPALAPRQRAIVDSASEMLRLRLDQAPIAFRLLPVMFTLSELQEVYELLLGRRLHKASFRRALQGAWLVEPTDEWRSEGRGRPAQLFRYAPRKRRGNRRGVRFDLLV